MRHSCVIFDCDGTLVDRREDEGSKPHPGMEELISRLKAKKIKIAVLSDKPADALHRVIDNLFPAGSFDAVRGGQPGLKPDPSVVWDLLVELNRSPHETIFAGDTENDMEMARSAGCYPMGVSWGFRTREALEQAGAAFVIDSPDQIWKLL